MSTHQRSKVILRQFSSQRSVASSLPSRFFSTRPPTPPKRWWPGRSFPSPNSRLSSLTTSLLLAVSLSLLYQQSQPLHLEAPAENDTAGPSSPGEDVHIDASTKQPLPKRLASPLSLSLEQTGPALLPFTLIASGVRTVSFLRVQVYVAALYVHEEHYTRFIKNRVSKAGAPEANLEQLVQECLESGCPIVLRIVPVKNTDFAHLRDGFTRAVHSRQKHLRKSETPPTEEQEETLAGSVIKMKECFPKASLKKGEALDLVFKPSIPPRMGDPTGVNLSLEHGGRILGTVKYDEAGKDLDVAKLLLQAYVADKDPVSEVFKKAVEEQILHRR